LNKLVVVDGYTVNPGDHSWDGFRAVADIEVYDRTPAPLLIERARNADLVITNKVRFPLEVLQQLPRLRYIGVSATGYDIVDVKAAREQGITVTNVPAYGTASVAQAAIALLLELCNRVEFHSDAARSGGWGRNPDWSYVKTPLTELAGKTMGIIGFGRIGQQVARIAEALGMRVISTRNESLDEIFRTSDVISLHVPLTPETRELVNAARLAQMTPSAILINTARGLLVNEQDLAGALNAGRIAGAGLDVLTVEPPVDGSPLLSARNCIVTPHVAWATKEARARLLTTVLENVQGFLDGTPRNIVNG
jgi:glycerate dehydrogenase